jgi:hypothetical protein
MSQYKVAQVGMGYSENRYCLYKKVYFFFWAEIHTFYTYPDTKESAEESARDIIKRLEGIYFEA